MHVTASALSTFILAAVALDTVVAYTTFHKSTTAAFIGSTQTAISNRAESVAAAHHTVACPCALCIGSKFHRVGCNCSTCRAKTALFSTAESSTPATASSASEAPATKVNDDISITSTSPNDVTVPAEVEALDGIASDVEAHNAERPARKSLKKKGPKGKALSEFSVGETLQGRVKTLASYGAFVDIGAQTDGLLHVSQLSVGFVKDVNDVLKINDELQVRIISINESKNQVSLSMLTQAESDEAESNKPQRNERNNNNNNSNNNNRSSNNNARTDDSAVVAQLVEKGWDSEKFVEGTVVSVVDFGAFVRIDTSQLNSECAGTMDGLVHISALTKGRAASVASIVSVDDKVQVRVKNIQGSKVSLTMISVEDETANAQSGRDGGSNESNRGGFEGAKDWKESLKKVQNNMPTFKNTPMVVDLRK